GSSPGRFLFAVTWLGCRHQGIDESSRSGGDLVDRAVKGCAVGLGWAVESAELADELKGCGSASLASSARLVPPAAIAAGPTAPLWLFCLRWVR
ncbi:MAG: hypothetical protein WBV35_21265, partial [Steroidobacteraceae bacterium]